MSLQFKKVLTKPLNFNYWVRTLPQEGSLAWEYNPFRNYRLSQDAVFYNNQLNILDDNNSFVIGDKTFTYIPYTDLIDGEGNIYYKGEILENSSLNKITKGFTYYKAGSLVDFETDELNFDLEHPVEITPQYSYDNSVNLILNDGLNSPKLINSRFSPIGRNKYQIVDRTGVSDTNIYDQGSQFDLDTSLYKKTILIPKIHFKGTYYGGTLPVGNYHFYFKFMDADGNTTDFVGESGLVSLFIGQTPQGIHSGFRNENSNKLVQFNLTNVDSAYPYVEVYYTRATSDIRENFVKEAVRIDKKFIVEGNATCKIVITGQENKETIPFTELNLQYNIVNSAQTQAICQNRLFLGNVHKKELNQKDLKDLALRICPKPDYTEYNPELGESYSPANIEQSYYSSNFIYNKVGYWPDEYYRLGVVFIMQDNTLSSVYNVRGQLNLNSVSEYTPIAVYGEDGTRIYIDTRDNFIVDAVGENSVGVISIQEENANHIIGLSMEIPDDVQKELKSLGVQGLFFVRQTRIPTTICQALTIGTDQNSHIPIIGITSEDEPTRFITERFIDDKRILNPRYEQRLFTFSTQKINAAICPEYDVNPAYLNQVFTGDDLLIVTSKTQPKFKALSQGNMFARHYINNTYVYEQNETQIQAKVIGIQDSTELVAIDENNQFSSRAGSGEEVHRFKFLEYDNKVTKASNIVRGNFGPYIGFDEELENNRIVNIRTMAALSANQLDIRASDNSAFYAISDRYTLDEFVDEKPYLYRGDCYICQFTHRINRNFNSSTAPYNDIIVDPNTFKDNIKYTTEVLDQEKASKVNLGDLNAVKLGMWVTSMYRSSINLNIRGVDGSFVEEAAEVQHPRTFYPLQSMSVAGIFKLPEAQCFNAGLQVSVSEKWNAVLEETPYNKDEFSNRILYSDISVNDAYKNGFRVFKSTNFKDYPKTYGSITKLVELGGNLICVFEHGVALIPINERAVAAQGDGGYAFINTSNVLPDNPKILSDSFGSQWRDSIVKTPLGIYGIDTVARKIWFTDGNTFKNISELRVQKFLNDNISLGERELTPLVGIRNVKSFYNSYKHDVLFTFYDNLNGFEEKVWNLCYNEMQEIFTTFYSWVPSLMECIDNIPFSFDRNTAKWISRMTHSNILSNNIIPNNGGEIGNIVLDNVTSAELCKDIWGNYKNFSLKHNSGMGNLDGWVLFCDNYSQSELYYRNEDGSIKKDSSGKRMYLPKDQQKNPDKIVILLNIRVIFNNGQHKDYTVAVMPEYNKQFLTTDFWKHGQAGIIDITEDIRPTYWYGKQHPFEFEFIAVDNPAVHKIFTNIELIANKAKPKSFHYEIVGECYDFVKDKPNMYYRQEAMKALCQYKGFDISYARNFVKAPIKYNVKSSDLLHKYYARQDMINDVEDYYTKATSPTGMDYKNIVGAELIYYPDRQEYRLWQHAEAISLDDLDQDKSYNILKANCKYLEDRWKIQINPIKIAYKNEDEWTKPPFAIKNISVPGFALNLVDKKSEDNNNEIYNEEEINDYDNVLNGTKIIVDNTEWNYIKEIDLKDKFIKVRIRYSGEELAVIDFINTLYNISYS